ncbi:trypsin-4-like [Aphidius gifuensis]|uniref:trypsin-4-like n=1 Tax=Aphidius gifuensis TaxID=684658 RepID=UPI001CDBB182|nr:trypsin-4-like [Aphidius gifuensis]
MFYSQVSLRWQETHLCAGTIISTMHILTAASCIIFERNTFASNVEILSGTADQLDAYNPGYLSEVSLLINHPDYDPRTPWIDDISILKLAKPIVYSRFRLNSDLPYKRHSSNIVFKISGWGDTSVDQSNQQSSRYLKYSHAKVLNYDKCIKYLKQLFLYLTNSQSCACMTEKNEGILNGDGGGGIIDMDDVYGIISLRIPFENDMFIFTQVWKHVDWIEKMIL